ncbi:MAG: SpoIIE family protein phosphatase, partial [Pseudomonadota bacterium]
MAVQTIEDFFNHTENEDATWPFHFDTNLSYEENRILGGIQMANRSILRQSSTNRNQEGMGTTIVALCFSKTLPLAYLGHAGDSRGYRVRDGEIKRLTRDHSLISDFEQAMPDISEEKKESIPKNIITRALGMQPYVEVELNKVDVLEGDLFLLCSDGLSGASEDMEILKIIKDSGSNLSLMCKKLVELANGKGGDDNITVVLARIKEIRGESRPAAADDDTVEVKLDPLKGE